MTGAPGIRVRKNGPVRSSAVLGALTLTTLALSAGFGSGPASAAGFGSSFAALAAADGVRVTVIVPNGGLADEIVDAGGPSVQARMDSLGTSKAFASFPYPGDTVANLPGLVRTLSGGVPVPDLPFFVQSDHPIVPKQEAGTGPYVLRAESSDSTSTGTASVGLAAEGTGALGLARSDAAVISGPEAVVSEATSAIEGFVAGPFRLGHVVSHARVSLAVDGTLTKAADTEIAGAMVGSTAVTITSEGLGVGDTKAPVPDTAPVEQALASAGITVEVTPRQELPSGVVAPAVRVTQTQSSGSKVIYMLGAASASVAGEGAEAAVPGLAGEDPTQPPGATPSTDPVAPVPTPADTTAAQSSGATSDLATPALAALAGVPSVEYPTSFVVPSTGTAGSGLSAGGLTGEVAAPVAPAPSVTVGRVGSARGAALAALLGTGVDTKPMYGAVAAGGVLALALALVMRGLKPRGAAR